MPLSFSRKAYEDCFILFDRALASKNGVQKLCASHDEAFHLRARLNKARALDAKLNKTMYEAQPDHPLYNTSEYYQLTVRIEEDPFRQVWLCRLEKNTANVGDVEEIPDEDGIDVGKLEPLSTKWEPDMEPSGQLPPMEEAFDDDIEGMDGAGDLGTGKERSPRDRRF